MGRIVVTEFISLDGVIEDPGGCEEFKYGGWSFEFNRGEEGDKLKVDETMEAEALLLGRVTYEGFADAWPSRSGEFADKFNSMPKYVAPRRSSKAEWTNSTVLKGDVVEAVVEAAERPRRGHRGPRQRPARAGAAGARPGRRVAADGLPGRAGEREAPLR